MLFAHSTSPKADYGSFRAERLSRERPTRRRCAELEEELGAGGVHVDGEIASSVYRYDTLDVDLHAYRVTCHVDSMTPFEHDALSWLSAAEISSVPIAPADAFIVELLRASQGS